MCTDEVYPLRRVHFNGVEVNAMTDPVPYLTRTYGADWDRTLTMTHVHDPLNLLHMLFSGRIAAPQRCTLTPTVDAAMLKMSRELWALDD
jgi:hypothetical protein